MHTLTRVDHDLSTQALGMRDTQRTTATQLVTSQAHSAAMAASVPVAGCSAAMLAASRHASTAAALAAAAQMADAKDAHFTAHLRKAGATAAATAGEHGAGVSSMDLAFHA